MKVPASKSHYYVVYDGAWKIQCDGENSEPYPRRYEALRDAVGLAHLDVRNGRDAQSHRAGRGRLFPSAVGFRRAIPIRRRWCPNPDTQQSFTPN